MVRIKSLDEVPVGKKIVRTQMWGVVAGGDVVAVRILKENAHTESLKWGSSKVSPVMVEVMPERGKTK